MIILQVVIRGLIFNSSDATEVIAIDDLSFSQGCVQAAGPSQFDCGSGVCVDAKTVCDFTPDCPHGEDEADCSALCDFEAGSCGWHEFAPADGFDWVRHSPKGIHADYQHQAPPRDHSTNTSTGHFMFVLKSRNSFSQQALLRSPMFHEVASDCTMTFWHYNAGMSVGAANMYLRIEGMDKLTVLWRTLYHQGNYWQPVTVQIGRQSRPFQLSVVKLSLGVYDGVSALDDIAFHNCSLPAAVDKCPSPDDFHCGQSRACVDHLKLCDLVDDCGDGTDEENCSPELMCDFEKGLCGWTQDTEVDIFDWTHIQGPTPTPNTGPFKDHTLGSIGGHYLYIESSAPQEFKDTAVLISRPFQPTAPREHERLFPCVFRLHYHMLGQHIFRLAVYIRTQNGGRGQMLWVRHGDQGTLWHRKTLYLNSARPFQVLVEGTVGDDFTGDIAIDDLSFLGCLPYKGSLPSVEASTPPPTSTPNTVTPHSCPQGQFVCGTHGGCVNQSQVCDFRQDCSDGSDEKDCVLEECSFEAGGLCGWNLHIPAPPVPLHAFRWQTGQGETIHHGEEYHRPVNDHTLATAQGWYIYADSSNGGYGHTSDLLTPPIATTGPQCTMGFWYYMNGFTVGTLQVFIKSGDVTQEVWYETGNQGNRWMRGEVFIGIRQHFQVILRAKRGISYMGDVVVDDVAFLDCAPPVLSGLPCTKHQFACANGHCIPHGNLCDFIDHCGDGSDEDQHICKGSRCDFEFDLCSWRQLKNDSSNWLINSGRPPTPGTGPSTDHTFRNSSGHYLYLESSFPMASGATARIAGEQFSHHSRDCRMVFYLQMSGEGTGTLNVYLLTSSSHFLLLNLTGHQGNYWIRQEVALFSKEPFWVMFEGKVGRLGKGDICLDDITFSPGCLLSNTPDPELPTTPPSGSCPLGLLQCINGGCYKTEQSCDFVDNCGDNTDEKDCGTSCSFENGLCGWKSSRVDNFDWTLGTGSAQKIRPPHDHTLMNENGHFVYLAATPLGLKGDKAHIRSSIWKESSATCKLTFWYYISHKATGVIRLFLKMQHEVKELWVEQSTMPVWRWAEVPLRNLRNFELIFEAERSRDVSGGAALDDLELTDCARSAIHPSACPASTDFVCSNGDCIESSLVCDSKADCPDASDELGCSGLAGSCDFNMAEEQWEASCQLAQEQDDDFDWQIGHGGQETGPSADHSPGGAGNYLYVNSAMQQEGDVARVTTQLEFPASTGVCHLRFWFHMHGSAQTGTLKVYTVGRIGVPLLMWAATGNHGDAWHYANVVLSNPQHFSVSFQTEVGGDRRASVAIDDLSFTRECAMGGSVTPAPATCDPSHFQCAHMSVCVPLEWRCDGKPDCADRSDEEDCGSAPPTAPPTATPPQTACAAGQYRCDGGLCQPALLRCDGVDDCPRADDERGCPVAQCNSDELVCEGTGICVPHNRRCDQTVDCPPFNSDESSCDECPEGYCLNAGICVVGTHGPVCICQSLWTGNRCHVHLKLPRPTNASVIPDSDIVVVYTGVSVAVILLAIIAGTILFFLHRKHTAKDAVLMASEEQDTSVCVWRDEFPGGNFTASSTFKPGWGASHRPRISVYPWREEPEFSARLSFSNPLYKGSRNPVD
ncbi:MAM and LDL-receptor class A domain-containing protein 1 [Brachyhypopomus gauderio]|uniref:MAM and LDL-receptor class A domain-containing protein 1 n=1 Tax=Brachyhypopomus gauderio TaxID=698409 RepID=UPI004041A71C